MGWGLSGVRGREGLSGVRGLGFEWWREGKFEWWREGKFECVGKRFFG